MSKFEIGPLIRQDHLGKITFMCRSGGYVMCRRPRCVPFVLSEKAWRKLAPYEAESEHAPITSMPLTR